MTTIIKYTDQFVVAGPGDDDEARLDDQDLAEAEVRERMRSLTVTGSWKVLTDADGEFNGGITWSTEREPATLFDELVIEYAEDAHGFSADGDPEAVAHNWQLSRDGGDFLLIEAHRRGGHWLSRHGSVDEAAVYHWDQEYAQDWSIVQVVDLRNGDRYEQGRTATLVKVEADA